MKKEFMFSSLIFAVLFLFVFDFDATGEIVQKIPVAKGLASHPVNGGHCLISDGEHQYLAFYDGDHQLTVAKRRLSDTGWEFAKLPEKVGWDTHNKILLFMDRAGYLHITGNMHCAPLRYYRTENPGDIQTFKGIHTWTGRYEDRVTYPNLLKLRDGSCHIMYRDGGSGDGRRLLVHYDEETQTWTGTGRAFISGRERDPTCNAYPFGGIREDNSGVLHIAWCWRETPDVVTNFDVCYAKSDDKGHTWKRWDGSTYDLPIRPENAEVVDPIPQRKGLINGGTLAVDHDGLPTIGYTRFDERGCNQLFVATPVGKEWRVIQLTDWEERFWFEGRGTIPRFPSIPRVSIAEDNKIHIGYSNSSVEPSKGSFIVSREELLNLQPGEADIVSVKKTGSLPGNIRARNVGPLPKGEKHYMQQEVDKPNRDRKPENPRSPTMIYILEIRNEKGETQ